MSCNYDPKIESCLTCKYYEELNGDEPCYMCVNCDQWEENDE